MVSGSKYTELIQYFKLETSYDQKTPTEVSASTCPGDIFREDDCDDRSPSKLQLGMRNQIFMNIMD